MNRIRLRDRPQIVVAIGVFFTSLSAILIRLSTAPALVIASYRLLFSVALLTPLYLRELSLARRRRHGTAQEHAPARGTGAGMNATGRLVAADDPSRQRPTTAIFLSAASGVFLALHFALWITSLDYTSVASSTVLVTTHPVLVATTGAILLGERITVRGVVLILTAVAGSVLLVAGGLGEGESQSFGNLLAFLGAVAVGGYIILGRVVRRTLSVNAYTMIVYSVAAGLLVAATLLFRVPLRPYAAREFVLFASLALFCTLLGHSLLSWSLKFVRPTLVSTSILGEPVVATLLALVIFGEAPSLFTIAGGAVILASIYLFIRLEAGLRTRSGAHG